MRTLVDLRAVDRGVHAADGLVGHATSVRVRQAMVGLEEVDVLLAALVADENLTIDVTSQLGRIRSDLAGHLLAARAMEELDVAPEKVADILRRGAAAARIGVERIVISR